MRNEICLSIYLLLIGYSLSSQISTVDGFNYYDINHSAFTVNASCANVDIEVQREFEYWFTSFELAEKVTSVFNQDGDNAQAVVGDYLILKDHYLNQELGNEPYKWILMRPNDDVDRPVIVLTHGGKSSDATTQRVLSLGAFDYLQRGYAVVYFQSGVSAAGDEDQGLLDLGLTTECTENNGIDKDNDCFQQAVYIKMLFNRAAVQYTVAKAAEYNLDAESLFISGFSGGGVGTLYTALAEESNFSDELFQGIIGFNGLSIYPDQEFTIKAASTLAGGIIDPSSESYKITGDLIDESDSEIRFLMLHGQDDTAVKADIGPLQWVDPAAELPGSRIASALNIKEYMDAAGIENKVVINCSAGHSIISYPCEFNDDDFTNNPKFSVGLPPDCLKWALPENYSGYNYSNLCSADNAREFGDELAYTMMQFHDLSKINAAFFSMDIEETGPPKNQDEFLADLFAANEITTVLPTDFPYDESITGIQNGHLTITDRCLSQSCTALYFDKFGVGNSILIFGDFLQFKGSSLSSYNSDFTLELKVKEIDHEGKGVLFSHLNNFNIGFELFINGDGNLQFWKNVNGNGNIIGDVTLLDGDSHHVALVRSGNEFSIYLDGVIQGESKTWNIDFPVSSRMRIGNTGNDIANGNHGFNGAFRSFRQWDKVVDVEDFGLPNLPTDTEGLLADFIFDQRFGQEIFSTNAEYTIQLGNNENNINYDPRWMSDDVQCEFNENCIVNTSNTIIDNFEVSVSPNPSAGNVTVDFPNSNFKEKILKVFTVDGKLVTSFNTMDNSTLIYLNSPGIYLLRIQENDMVVTKKILIL